MTVDAELADRVREALAPTTPYTERNMFGGLAFMVGGHMACGVLGDDLGGWLDRALAFVATLPPK